MVIPVPTSSKDVLRAYILCLNPILKLKPREIDLVDAMLKVYYNLKKASKAGQIKLEDIDSRLNDPMGRKIVRDIIKMSEASHNNHYAQLKKKKIITPENKLQEFLKKLDSSDLTVNYKINIIKPKETEKKLEVQAV